MPRPQRCRRICCEPEFEKFSPSGAGDTGSVVLTLDEFEVIRLVDLEKQTHEQCAKQMDISRTTVTEICESARQKIADCLVNGKKAEYVGNICMDVAMIDVTDIDCKEGDQVILFGEELPVTVLSDAIDTIPYEVLTGISNRVKRVYYQD